MAKADLEMALVKSCGRSPLTPDELLELLNVDIGQLITNHDMDLYQAEEVMMWRKHEALRYSAHLASYPQREKLEESKKISKRQLDSMILTEVHPRAMADDQYVGALEAVDDLMASGGRVSFAPGKEADEVYIMTGQAEGITVKVLRRGR